RLGCAAPHHRAGACPAPALRRHPHLGGGDLGLGTAEIDAALELLRERRMHPFLFVSVSPCEAPYLLRRHTRIERAKGKLCPNSTDAQSGGHEEEERRMCLSPP
ncbi:MAG TPA: hypothetical protein VFY89_09945, partial [Ktedonobacterales bacterium]